MTDRPPLGRPTGHDEALHRFGRNQFALAGTVVLAVVVGATLLAPTLGVPDPLEMNPQHLLESPSHLHLLGTDEFGRDILSRVIWGARTSIRVSAISVGIA